MGKIAQVSAKYIIHSTIEIDGMVDRPDVIGAVFGQTEGLLGADLELRELQRSGRIGRIEVNVDTKTGKTKGTIIIPSSLDKAETSIVGAALEIIQRIGPCNAKIRVIKIEDVRISKRQFVIDRAKELLKTMMDNVLPDSQELADEVSHSVRVMEIVNFGPDKLAAGPAVEESDEITLVEGRADVLNLLKHGIKNSIAINGTSVPQTIVELCKKKIVTVFVDGDRGGDLIIKELLNVAEIDFVAKAPDGKEVEEITNKEIHKALRSKISAEQMKLEISDKNEARENSYNERRNSRNNDRRNNTRRESSNRRDSPREPRAAAPRKPAGLSSDKKEKFAGMLEDLIGTRGAFILDEKLEILGKVPSTEIAPTVKSLNGGIYAVVFDGEITKDLLETAEKASVKCLVGMDNKIKPNTTRLNLLTPNDF